MYIMSRNMEATLACNVQYSSYLIIVENSGGIYRYNICLIFRAIFNGMCPSLRQDEASLANINQQ